MASRRNGSAPGILARIAAKLSWRRPEDRAMTPAEFELLVGEGFRLQGYVVTETGSGADGGADLVLQKDHERFFVQCSHWRAAKVDADAVRQLLGIMAAQGAAGGFVVTTGEFTAQAAEFAHGVNIFLVNGARLAAMLAQARQTLTIPPRIEPRLRRGTLPA